LSKSGAAVAVQVQESWTPFFAHFLGADITPVIVKATAELVGQAKICVLALDDSESDALELDNGGRLQGQWLRGVREFEALGSHQREEPLGNLRRTSPVPLAAFPTGERLHAAAAMTDCPPVEDPLSSRPAPASGRLRFHQPQDQFWHRDAFARGLLPRVDIDGFGQRSPCRRAHTSSRAAR
jgi:hypothetical protein